MKGAGRDCGKPGGKEQLGIEPAKLGRQNTASQWIREFRQCLGGAHGALAIAKAIFGNAGNYRVVVTNATGSVTSVTVKLTIR
ncbi:MAG: hypothetical protein ABSH19_03490 [Opitutales bacterium]|jgi:hypothetical protein